jgi:hypothetical protein
MTSTNTASFAIKRRYMTFAEAENERTYRTKHVALLNMGDMFGLESYACDLPTYMNSARCTAPCDLFYMLKHNFVRIQKRHGTLGLNERLRDTVLLSFRAYPSRIIQLPLFQSLIKRQLALSMINEQPQQYYGQQSWLTHVSKVNHAACADMNEL